jgi:hypothetical protein
MADNSPPGWHRLGIISKSELRNGLRKRLLERFLSVLEFPARGIDYFERKFSEVLVRGYQEIPRGFSPGGNFLPVGYFKREPSKSSYNRIRRILRQNQPDCVVSFVLTSGPGFAFSEVIPEYERVPTEKVLWARWQLPNGQDMLYCY